MEGDGQGWLWEATKISLRGEDEPPRWVKSPSFKEETLLFGERNPISGEKPVGSSRGKLVEKA